MPTNPNFQPVTILYASNLNAAFANVVNVAGDTMTGTLFIANANPSLVASNGVIANTLSVNTSIFAGTIQTTGAATFSSLTVNSDIRIAGNITMGGTGTTTVNA